MKDEKSGLYHGNIEASITSVKEYCPDFFQGLSMLITVLDSSPEPALLPKWIVYILSREWDGVQIVDGKYVYVPEQYVSLLFEEELTFFNFDEVFLLDELPEGCSKEKYYTPERYDFSMGVPDSFVEYFTRINARRYLSDGSGFGLNYACLSKEEEAVLVDKESVLRKNM